MMIDLGRAFRAPFDDPGWVKKTLFGLLWGLLGVTAPAIYGAQVEYIRGVSRGDERLPEWDDFGKKWVEGFMISLAGFIYFLPAFALILFSLVPVLMASDGNSNALGALAGGTMCLVWLVVIVYTVAISVLFSAATVHYAMSGSFGAFFQFGDILAKVRGGSGYWTAWLYVLLISFAGSTVSSILSATGIGYILFGAVMYLMAMMSGHVFGQWARDAYGIAAPAAAPAAPAGYAAPAAPVAPSYQPPAAPAPQPPAQTYVPTAPQPPAAPVPPAPEPPAPYAPPATPEPPVAPPVEPPAAPPVE